MLLLKPEFAMLDEIDSGLDVDALVRVADAINYQKEQTNISYLVISHYARLYSLINPSRVTIMINGKIAVNGGVELIARVDKEGYEWIKYELGIDIAKEDAAMNTVSLGECATRNALENGQKK
jgi:Fe-S cluster assembly ATP-binding protein